MGFTLRGRRLAAGIALCRRRRLGPQAKNQIQRRTADLCGSRLRRARDGPARSQPVQGSRWRVVDCREPDTFRSQGGVAQHEYVSGVLTTQKIVFPEIRVFRVPRQDTVGHRRVAAFWLLAKDGGWPPEIDAMEGRGQRPGDVVMTTHWRIPATGFSTSS